MHDYFDFDTQPWHCDLQPLHYGIYDCPFFLNYDIYNNDAIIKPFEETLFMIKNKYKFFKEIEIQNEYNIVNHDDDLICCVCCNLYDDPYYFGPCNHTFCKICIEKSIKTNNNCPLCRSNVVMLKPNNKIIDLVNNVYIKCSLCNDVHKIKYKCNDKLYKCNNCSQTIKAHLLKNHLVNCKVIEKCINCQQFVITSLKFSHEYSCKLKISKKNNEHILQFPKEPCNMCKGLYFPNEMFVHMLKCQNKNKKKNFGR